MSQKLSKYLGRPTVTDGAWGTQLQEQGLPPGACPDVWNVENVSAVEAVARSYVEAGSEIILTNTFRANRFALEHWDLSPLPSRQPPSPEAALTPSCARPSRIWKS